MIQTIGPPQLLYLNDSNPSSEISLEGLEEG